MEHAFGQSYIVHDEQVKMKVVQLERSGQTASFGKLKMNISIMKNNVKNQNVFFKKNCFKNINLLSLFLSKILNSRLLKLRTINYRP